jgi:glutathione-regulated potassium-efflux system ancillary protein KefF
MILIIYVHPATEKSRVNQMMLRQASNNPDVLIRSLYGLYPDFIIDVQAEQQALEQAELSSVDSAKSLAAC